jgi:DNA-directed RNA polymerase subunit RPC12/RpoP
MHFSTYLIFQVTVTAKVIKKLESVEQDLNFSRKMQRTTFIIADESTAIQLTLWGPEDQILVDNCYKFENLSIKVFECTKLSTNPYTRITKVDALQNVHVTDLDLIQKSNVKILKGKICGVDIQLQYKCFFCKANVTINEDIQSLKCPECLKRQLTSTVSKNVKTELSIVIDNSTETFSLPQQVLDIYTLGVEKFEDKELFLLQHSNVEVKVFNNSIIKEMKQNF